MSQQTSTYDVIVLGIGTMGSAVCDHLSQRGARVLGLEQFSVPHALGAMHGDSRLIRLCYFEHPDYVPLLHRTYELWEQLEQRSQRSVLRITGGIYMGPERSEFVTGTLRSAREHDLPHERLGRDEFRRRYPVFEVPDDTVAIYEPRAGFVLSETAVSVQVEQALRRGAHVHGHEPVRSWRVEGGAVVVETTKATYSAG
ncbi:MAG: FAD-dependent oxidoreductase, partial [Planctomycetota bacterium]